MKIHLSEAIKQSYAEVINTEKGSVPCTGFDSISIKHIFSDLDAAHERIKDFDDEGLLSHIDSLYIDISKDKNRNDRNFDQHVAEHKSHVTAISKIIREGGEDFAELKKMHLFKTNKSALLDPFWEKLSCKQAGKNFVTKHKHLLLYIQDYPEFEHIKEKYNKIRKDNVKMCLKKIEKLFIDKILDPAYLEPQVNGLANKYELGKIFMKYGFSPKEIDFLQGLCAPSITSIQDYYSHFLKSYIDASCIRQANADSENLIPDITVCVESGKKRYRLRKLDQADPVIFVLGNITNDCTKGDVPGSQGWTYCTYGASNPKGGFYVIEKLNAAGEPKIVGQTFAYINPAQHLVFNIFVTKHHEINQPMVERLFKLAASHIVNNIEHISQVNIAARAHSSHYCTLGNISNEALLRPDTPNYIPHKDFFDLLAGASAQRTIEGYIKNGALTYFDSREQAVVCTRDQPVCIDMQECTWSIANNGSGSRVRAADDAGSSSHSQADAEPILVNFMQARQAQRQARQELRQSVSMLHEEERAMERNRRH